jgi:hypothetical protein
LRTTDAAAVLLLDTFFSGLSSATAPLIFLDAATDALSGHRFWIFATCAIRVLLFR